MFFFHRPLEVQQRSNIWNKEWAVRMQIGFAVSFNLDRIFENGRMETSVLFSESFRSVNTVFTSLSCSLPAFTVRWALEIEMAIHSCLLKGKLILNTLKCCELEKKRQFAFTYWTVNYPNAQISSRFTGASRLTLQEYIVLWHFWMYVWFHSDSGVN